MNKMKKVLLALLLAAPMMVSASGIGLYVPYSLGDSKSVTIYPDDNTGNDREFNYDLQSGAGIGFTFDSNIGKDSLFNYRLGLEYTEQKFDKREGGHSCTNDCEYGTKFNIVNTFGFGVLRTQTVRLWVGPRINIALEKDTQTGYSTTYTRNGAEIGIAPAIGINVNLGRYFALAADVDYRFAATFGDTDVTENSSYYNSNTNHGTTYGGTATGATLRFYALFKFGEDFSSAAPEPTNSTDAY